MTNLFNTNRVPTWCAGCGNFIVKAALEKSLKNLKIKPQNVVVCFDIGCAGNMSDTLDVCTFETLHGRSVAVASGIKTVRPELKVIAQAGDGGLLNEGLNHFIHAVQKDIPITVILNNNFVFALTAGQKSSATPKGETARSSRAKNEIAPLNAIDLALASGARFLARVPEKEISLMRELVEKALGFNGFALIEVIQPCRIWAKDFSHPSLKILQNPATKRSEIAGRTELAGLLYLEE